MKKFPQLTKALKNIAAICGIATCFLACSIDSYGQIPGPYEIGIEANDVSTVVRNNGQLFYDGTRGRYFVPRDSVNGVDVASIYAAGLWIGYRARNNPFSSPIHTSIADYGMQSGSDFRAGVLIPNASGQVTAVNIGFNKVWKVEKWQIESHIANYDDDGTIQLPIQEILAWPGRNNPYFGQQNGGTLPANRDYAPFFDRNNDGTYDPMQGDYPILQSCPTVVIPDQLTWFTMYDSIGANYSGNLGYPMLLEIHGLVYGFNLSPANDHINRTTFVKYKIINQSGITYSDMKLGFWSDVEIGCNSDDKVGCIPSMNTYYGYNGSNMDNLTGCEAPGYGAAPPVQAFTTLSHSLNGFSYYVNHVAPNPNMTDPNIAFDYYNYLNGNWRDGSPMVSHGNGYDPNSTGPYTRFAFDGNPNDTTQWSMPSEADVRALGVTDIDSLQAGESVEWLIALSFHRENSPTATNLTNVDYMRARIPTVQSFYQNCYTMNGYTQNLTCHSQTCIWTGDSDRNDLVNAWDYLTLGTAIGQSNPMGAPSTRDHTTWPQQRPSTPWSNSTPYGVNFEYLDFNGDGRLNESDKSYIDQKMGRQTPYFTGLTDPTIQGEKLKMIRMNTGMYRKVILNNGDLFGFEVLVDSSDMSPIAGIAFELEYNKCDVNNSLTPLLQSTFYHSIGNTTMQYVQRVPSSSTSMTSNCTEIVRFPVAIVRVDGQDTVGQNLKIARFAFRLDIDTNAISTSVIDTLWFRFRNVKGIRANGTTFNLGAQDLPIPYTKALVGLDEALDEPETFELFPNPTNSVFHLELATSPAEQGLLQIADQMGRIVLSQSIDQQSSIVNVESLPAGLYVVKITGNEMQYQPKKLLIQQR